jgi:hypothetical protein
MPALFAKIQCAVVGGATIITYFHVVCVEIGMQFSRAHSEIPVFTGTPKQPVDTFKTIKCFGIFQYSSFYIGKDGRVPGLNFLTW